MSCCNRVEGHHTRAVDIELCTQTAIIDSVSNAVKIMW